MEPVEAAHRSNTALGQSAADPQAFGVFYRANFEPLLRFVTRRVLNADVALDVTAETFAQAFLGRKKFRGSSDEEAAAWLYRIARRQLARYFKKGEAERRAITRLGIELPVLDGATRDAIEDYAGLDAVRGLLRGELSRLSPRDREAVRLRVIDELPYVDVAEQLGVSEATARTRVSRALKALASRLDRYPQLEEVLT